MAHAMAMETPKVTADVVEVQEFPALGQLNRIMGVPKTVINNTIQFTGAVPEETFIRKVMEAVGQEEALEEDSVEVYGDTTPLA